MQILIFTRLTVPGGVSPAGPDDRRATTRHSVSGRLPSGHGGAKPFTVPPDAALGASGPAGGPQLALACESSRVRCVWPARHRVLGLSATEGPHLGVPSGQLSLASRTELCQLPTGHSVAATVASHASRLPQLHVPDSTCQPRRTVAVLRPQLPRHELPADVVASPDHGQLRSVCDSPRWTRSSSVVPAVRRLLHLHHVQLSRSGSGTLGSAPGRDDGRPGVSRHPPSLPWPQPLPVAGKPFAAPTVPSVGHPRPFAALLI